MAMLCPFALAITLSCFMNFFANNGDVEIRRLLRSAGQQAKQMARQGLQVSQKGPGDFVTNVDEALDRQLFAGFSRQFPKDGVITEENRASRQQFQADGRRLWCIDPLDGTEDFIQKRREYAVMAGALEAGQPIGGWIYAPEDDCLYYGGPTWGLWQQVGEGEGKALLAKPPLDAAPGTMILGSRDRQNFGDLIQDAIPNLEFAFSKGSFGLKVMHVIGGHAGIYIYLNGRVKVWDTVGPLALAQAAGLTCCDLAGQPLSYTYDAINLETLAHRQSIVIGWASYIEKLLPPLRTALAAAKVS
jgi:3'(2'), 5'-bisphosphate nucleotidase